MGYLILLAVVGVACFVAGALVYRNNAKKFESKAAELASEVERLKKIDILFESKAVELAAEVERLKKLVK